MIKPEYKYSELTGKIIGCAIEVHKFLGNGFQEVIYQRALEYEMSLQEVEFTREFEMPVFYKDKQIIIINTDGVNNDFSSKKQGIYIFIYKILFYGSGGFLY